MRALDEIPDVLYICRFPILFVFFIVFFIVFLVYRKKRLKKSKVFLSLCLIMISALIGILVVRSVSPDDYKCKVDEALVLELKEALENCNDISVLEDAPPNFWILIKPSPEKARDILEMYIPKNLSEGEQAISNYSFKGVGGTKAELSKLYYYNSGDYYFYCTPIYHDKGNVVVPIFDFESFFVSVGIVNKNYYISFDDNSGRLSGININEKIEILIEYLKSFED